jgi:methionyl-tRNA formyltransferase
MRFGLLSTWQAPFLGYIIRAFHVNDVEVHAVILDPLDMGEKDRAIHEERTAGRFPPVPLAEFEDRAIPFYPVRNHASEATAALVRKLELDVLINAGTPRILPPALLCAPTLGVVNCHPGLLPQFRGCSCVEWAIVLNEQIGNTVHFMSERIDDGPVILREPLTFGRKDTYVDIRVKTYAHNIELLGRAMRKLVKENLTPAQLPLPVGETRYFHPIDSKKMQEALHRVAERAYAFQTE